MEKNRENKLIYALAIFAIFLHAIVTIVTCAAVWNSHQGAFPSVCAVVVFVLNGFIIYLEAKKMKWKDVERELNKEE